MIIKQPDDKSMYVDELEKLQLMAGEERRQQIERELRILRAGIKGEDEAAYLINFHYGTSNKTAIIHDLRVEIDGRVAQIDHLLIHRTLNVFALESKHFNAGVKITDNGEFLRWNPVRRIYEGMASPIEQNQRHIEVLRDAVAKIEMPTRLGVRLTPVFHSYILVSPNARIVRPPKFDTSKVIKADALATAIETQFDKAGFFDVLGSASRVVSVETLEDIAKRLTALHQPAQFDYAARFGMSGAHRAASGQEYQSYQCRACDGIQLSIQHGRYGYYFKCQDCGANTPIKVGCGQHGHKERIRKQGQNFYRECADCGTSSLLYVNPTLDSP
jgi:hypothetical protein